MDGVSNIFILLALEVLWGTVVKIGYLSNIATILNVPPPSYNVITKWNIIVN
jgi:hypothetical protein